MKTGLIGCRSWWAFLRPAWISLQSGNTRAVKSKPLFSERLQLNFGGTGAAQRRFELDNQYPEKNSAGNTTKLPGKDKKKTHTQNFKKEPRGIITSDCILINREDVGGGGKQTDARRDRKRECDRHVKWNNSDDGLRGTSLF